jgi:hypothetical protein
MAPTPYKYRPSGSERYARQKRADLTRTLKHAERNARRAKTAQTRRKWNRQADTARRGLRDIDARSAFREGLSEQQRSMFNKLPIREQQRHLEVKRRYPDYIPPPDQVPDPYAEPRRYRSQHWRLNYSTRAGLRRRAA